MPWRRITPRLSGVASLKQTSELDEAVAGHAGSTAYEEGHGHSNRKLSRLLILAPHRCLRGR